MSRAERMHKSTFARKRRRTIKDTIWKKTLNLFSKLRKKRRTRIPKYLGGKTSTPSNDK